MTGMKTIEERRSATAYGPYQVLSEMGRGGTGVVFKCRHEASGALAAVKVSRDTSRLQRDFIRKEVHMLARLARAGVPGVVRVLDRGESEKALWYAMDFIDGLELGHILRALWNVDADERVSRTETGPLTALTLTALAGPSRAIRSSEPTLLAPTAASVTGPPSRSVPPDPGCRAPAARGLADLVLQFGARLALTLAGIHAEGILHGDLKPRNIVLTTEGQPVLVDFGTALYTSDGRVMRELAQVEGVVHGTPGYMAPEQILGEPLDGRCDLYALGVILYELIAGRPPFVSDQTHALNRQHLHVLPPPPSSWVDEVPPALDQLILRLLEKDPRHRIGHALDVHEILTSLLPATGSLTVDQRHPPARTLYRPRLIGRTEVLRQLDDELERIFAGRSRGHLLLLGESGAGKTRLLNELGSRAGAVGLDVVASSCIEPPASATGLSAPALESLRPALQRIVDRHQLEAGPAPSEAIQESAAALAPYEPGMALLSGSTLPGLPAELARSRVLRSLACLLRTHAEPNGIVVLLDDVQWADELTLAFLASEHVDVLAGSRVLIVGTCREEQLPAVLKSRIDSAATGTLGLERLSASQVNSLIADMLATPLVPEGVSEVLYRQSEGNPLFATEWLRAYVETGLLARDGKGSWTASPIKLRDDQGPAVPGSLQELLDLRCGRLSPPQAEVLGLASVLGRTFTAEFLLSFDPEARNRITRILDELVGDRFLEETSPGEYRFVHDRVRQIQHSAVPLERRRQLHRHVASTLEVTDRHPSSDLPAALGHHWARAGEPEKAVPHLVAAAGTAEQKFANERAIELYRQTLAALDAIGANAPTLERTSSILAQTAVVAESLADLLALSGRHEEARHNYDRAMAALPVVVRSVRARLARKKAKSFWTVHDYTPAEAAFAQGEAALGAVEALAPEDHREWIEIQQGRFWLRYFAGQLGEGSARLLQGMAETVERFGTLPQRAMFYQCQAANILGPSRYCYSPVAVDLNRRALQLHEAHAQSPVATIEARFDLAFALVHGGSVQCAEAVELFQQVRDEATRAGDSTFLARALIYLAVGLRRLGRVVDTETVASDALAAAERARITPYIGAAQAHLAWVSWRSGKLDRAITLAEQARDWWKRGTHVYVFRWKAVLPLLAIHNDREQLSSLREDLEDLLHPSQQVFPDQMQEDLRRAQSSLLEGSSALTGVKAVNRVVEAALRLGYL
jgi:serine/threonine protein kinase